MYDIGTKRNKKRMSYLHIFSSEPQSILAPEGPPIDVEELERAIAGLATLTQFFPVYLLYEGNQCQRLINSVLALNP